MRSVIMCVDDDKYILHTLFGQLDEWFGKDYIVSKAESAEEALKIFQGYVDDGVTVSVFISDYIMPGMRGDELLKRIHDLKPSVKTVMLTGHSAIDGVVFAINNAGLYRYIAKPWEPKDLRLTIAEALKSFEQGQVMTRLYEDSKAFYTQYADSTRNLKLSFDKALSAVISVTENIFDTTRPPDIPVHCIAVKYYATELAKTQGIGTAAQFEVAFAGLIHEIGKYTLMPSDIKLLEKVRAETDYSSPVVTKMLNATLQLAEGFGSDYVKTLTGIYKKYSANLPLNTRILSVANMFDNLTVITGSDDMARQTLLKNANEGSLDPDLTRVFVKDVAYFKG